MNDIKNVLEYIQEREVNLTRATEKLRRNVERIANVFGNRHDCQHCAWQKNGNSHFRYFDRRDHRGYNEIPETLSNRKTKLVTPGFDSGRWGNPKENTISFEEHQHHTFVPKIYISLPIRDDESFFVSGAGEYYYLCFHAGGMKIERNDGDFERYIEISDLSRQALKALVKSGRIPKFLQKTAEKLDAAKEEYEDVATLAEKLTDALPTTMKKEEI